MAISYVFNDILLQGIRSGLVPARTKKARTWFRDKAKESNAGRGTLLSDKERIRSKIVPGAMFFFTYDPKTKAKLPYYDRFPLTVIVDVTADGFTGLNLHYLPYRERAALMDALYTISSNKKYDDTTRLRLSYNTLKGAGKFKAFKPCFKRYLGSHVRSSFVYVNPSEWDIALFLPVEQFKKAGKATVWSDSVGKF